MRIPPYYKRPGWQRFFAGFILGTLAGWAFFLSQFGGTYEELLLSYNKQSSTIQELEEQLQLLRDQEENQDPPGTLVVQSVDVTFVNADESRLNELTLHELEQAALDEVRPTLDQDISHLAEVKDFIIRTIENKRYNAGDQTYRLTVKELYVYDTLELHLEIQPASTD
ncbi:hypothetical protein B0H94_109145 [Salsuginibacillus halophilus]|uniref:Sporulation membrane protein YtrI C-terminal domain-containing protein n=1 Tax=Salsuginibacillus halophilus TaxID=517424 RepID=A0A2P8HCW7_9BACI|nr:sporulation membrane protein YtrI [Salsuginibacillus halophilus]PSL44083.1 hypothetical protein B0H94_109145 [Salsuginibacillus halophilus]